MLIIKGNIASRAKFQGDISKTAKVFFQTPDYSSLVSLIKTFHNMFSS